MENVNMKLGAIQNTGNPVFDSTVNLIMNWPPTVEFPGVTRLHELVSSIYEKEPKPEVSLTKVKRGGTSQIGISTEEIGAR